MTNDLFVHTPAHLLGARLNYLINRRLQPEVACQEVCIQELDWDEIRNCAASLACNNLATTVHAPFAGFNPGNPKRRIRSRAHQVCKDSIRLAEILGARRIVFHPGIPYQAPEKSLVNWLSHALDFWPDYISMAADKDIVLCLENIYERSADLFVQLFNEIGCKHFGHCFDVGHWNIFSNQPLAEWFTLVGKHIAHVHLHDNFGETDQHLPIGSGNIDFHLLFEQLDQLDRPPSLTLEAHKLPDLELSLQQVQRYL